MGLVLPEAPSVHLPVAGSDDVFPVRRIYCVGRNYAAHAREMGFDPEREAPFYFAKPADAATPVGDGGALDFVYPALTENLHYEAELVVALAAGGADIPARAALDHVWGYAVGLDMTRRDLQFAQRDKGRPWEVAKAFDASAPIGALTPAFDVPGIADAAVWLRRNGEMRQNSRTSLMIWSVAEVIADLSRYFQLAPGDLIFTGTPEGVAPVVPGDLLEAGVDGLQPIRVRIVAPRVSGARPTSA